ncbi:hypothetical protein [Paenibacillus periandrae]|uniref:hypothetical protein n=1 Tax=Paenibacillus periandrae TaxID=1761741 RepID=UPI001F08DB6D|nr:hypothetical protein [Paenibacillus periandrae]
MQVQVRCKGKGGCLLGAAVVFWSRIVPAGHAQVGAFVFVTESFAQRGVHYSTPQLGME